MDRAWAADWIGPGPRPVDDLGVFVFRRRFQWSGQACTVHVSADNRYKLSVNGQLIAFGPQRGDRTWWHYETLDLTPHLQPGGNVIEAVVWNFGRWAPEAQFTVRTGFICDSDDTPALRTTGDWEVARVEGWDFDMIQTGLKHVYVAVGPGEMVDFRQPLSGDRLEWGRPHVIERQSDPSHTYGDPMWHMAPRSIPLMRLQRRTARPQICDMRSGERQSFAPMEAEGGQRVVFDLGELVTAYPEFVLESEPGARVEITYAEAPNDGESALKKGHRDEIKGRHIIGIQDQVTTSGSEDQFSPLWWRTYRYVQLLCDKPLRIKAFESDETGYPLRADSSFVSDIPRTEELWDVSLRTARLCAHETYFDCPYYEQLQYVADTRIQAMIGNYLSVDRSLQRNAVDQFGRSVLPNGLTQSRYPSRKPQVIPGFSLWWIVMLHDQAFYDRRPIDPTDLEKARRILSAWHRISEGQERGLFWLYVDAQPKWPAGVPKGRELGSAQQLLRNVATICYNQLSGQNLSLPVEVEHRSDGLVVTTNDPEAEPSEQNETLWRTQLQLEGKPLPPWPEQALTDDMPRCSHAFSHAMHAVRRDEDYVKLLAPWYAQLDLGLTTFAEHAEPTRSDCHAWSSHPILGFFQTVAGVTSASHGWRDTKIEPRPGDLRHFEANIAHFDGTIRVAWQGGRLEVECPTPFELVWRGTSERHAAGRVTL